MLDTATVLTKLGIHIERETPTHYFALCPNPEHNDTNPSWNIEKDSGLHHCFSCGFSGNLITLVSKIAHVNPFDFIEVDPKQIREAKYWAVSERKSFPKIERELEVEGNPYPAHTSEEVMSYLDSIGCSREAIDYFDIRFLISGGIRFLNHVEYTRFRHRLFNKVWDSGSVVNIIGRDYTGKQTPKELYPRGSTTDVLFNLENVDLDKNVIVVEGFKALLRVWSLGYKNIVSTFGSQLGRNQLRLLESIPYLLLFPDNDEAGRKMVKQVENLGKDYRIAYMPKEDMDPSDGPDRWVKKVLDNALNVSDTIVKSCQESGVIASPVRTRKKVGKLW